MSSAIAGNLSRTRIPSRKGAPTGGSTFRISPATAIALVALFLALGGSTLAVGDGPTAARPRCSTGAVRGIASVVGDASAGIANLGGQFTSRRALFSRRFNCTGRAVQVRRVAAGVFEVRFVGNGAQSAVASSVGDAYADAELESGGVFKVSIHPAGRDDLSDRAFTIVVV
jgi:hypothetical protein